MVTNSRTFIIAEAGVNHNGDDNLALELAELAASAGADAVKFQTFKAEKLVTSTAQKAEYQARQTGRGTQFDMLKSLEFSESAHKKVNERCKQLGIEFMSTPFDEDAADFLISLGMRRIKIPSGELTNHPFLSYLAKKNLPMILSTGMATLDEISEAINVIKSAREQLGLSEPLHSMLTLLHCTSNYPAKCEDVNLKALSTIAQHTNLSVGYSDHTLGVSVSTAAVALGATVIEKHFTIDKRLPGPDHQASLSPEELKVLVKQIREVEQALGSPEKKPSDSELPIRDLVRRSVTAKIDLSEGEVILKDHLTLLRPGTGVPPAELANIVGRKLNKDISAGSTLCWEDVI